MGLENGFNYLKWSGHVPRYLSWSQNRENLVEIDESKVRNKTIILIDDVITTGRTFSSVANALYSNNAKSVQGVFLAQTTYRPKHGARFESYGKPYYWNNIIGDFMEILEPNERH